MNTVFKIIFATALCFMAAHCGQCNEPGLKSTWRPLFNGKDLTDFVSVNGNATYRIERGAIVGRTKLGSPNTFLATKRVYDDFELTFDVKVDGSLNSGVQIRSRENTDNNGRFFGPQVEIESGPGQAGYIYGEAMGMGWLSPNPKCKDPAINQYDYFKNSEWNSYRVIAVGARIRTFLNGVKIEDLTHEEAYESHPRGQIGLQVHSIKENKLAGAPYLEVRWRTLKIREL